jgi:hypothetical protein
VGLSLVFAAGAVWHNLVALSISQILVSAGVYLWLFNMFTYTAVAYPTRIRSVGTGCSRSCLRRRFRRRCKESPTRCNQPARRRYA